MASVSKNRKQKQEKERAKQLNITQNHAKDANPTTINIILHFSKLNGLI